MLSNGIKPDTILQAPTILDLPKFIKKLPNFNNRACGNGKVSLKPITLLSCNTPFAKNAMELGEDEIRKYAVAYGFNEKLMFHICL